MTWSAGLKFGGHGSQRRKYSASCTTGPWYTALLGACAHARALCVVLRHRPSPPVVVHRHASPSAIIRSRPSLPMPTSIVIRHHPSHVVVMRRPSASSSVVLRPRRHRRSLASGPPSSSSSPSTPKFHVASPSSCIIVHRRATGFRLRRDVAHSTPGAQSKAFPNGCTARASMMGVLGLSPLLFTMKILTQTTQPSMTWNRNVASWQGQAPATEGRPLMLVPDSVPTTPLNLRQCHACAMPGKGRACLAIHALPTSNGK